MKNLPFLKSTNFWNNFIGILLAVFISYGVEIPEQLPYDVYDAVVSKDIAAFVIAVYNLFNIVFHTILKPKITKVKNHPLKR